jgi:hypothetical protein
MIGRQIPALAALAAAGFVAAGSPASAQALNVKAGLWEVTSTGQGTGVPPVDTSRMTAEQRARYEAVMKSRMNGAPKTRKTCITKEKLAKDPFEERENGTSCKRTYLTRTSTTMAFQEECAGGAGTRTTEGHFEARNPESVTGNVKIVVDRGGKTMTIHNQLAGRFVGASCGDVK